MNAAAAITLIGSGRLVISQPLALGAARITLTIAPSRLEPTIALASAARITLIGTASFGNSIALNATASLRITASAGLLSSVSVAGHATIRVVAAAYLVMNWVNAAATIRCLATALLSRSLALNALSRVRLSAFGTLTPFSIALPLLPPRDRVLIGANTVSVVYRDALPDQSPSYAVTLQSLMLDGVPQAPNFTRNALNTVTFPFSVPADDLKHKLDVIWHVAHIATGLGRDTAESIPLTRSFLSASIPSPNTVTATLIRAGDATYPDWVRIQWSGPKMVQLIAYSPQLSKTLVLGYADTDDTDLVVENTRRLFPRDGKSYQVTYGAQSVSGLKTSDPRYATTLMLSAAPEPIQNPYDAKAVYWGESDLIASIAASSGQSDALIDAILRSGFRKIRQVLAKGGSVELAAFITFKAEWINRERVAKFVFDKSFVQRVQSS